MNDNDYYLDDIDVSIDDKSYVDKPDKSEMGKINNRVGKNKRSLLLHELAEMTGNKGHAFSGTVFKQDNISPEDKSNRKSKYFDFQVVFALDFDGTISFSEVLARANKYEIRIAFAYESYSSYNRSKFRVVFIHNQKVRDIRIAKIIMNSLHVLFPEADSACKDPGHIFLGGKNLFYYYKHYYDMYQPFTLFQLIECICCLYRETKKNHDKRFILKFCNDNNIAVTDKGLPHVHLIDKAGGSITGGCCADVNGILEEGLVIISLIYNRPSVIIPNTYYNIVLDPTNTSPPQRKSITPSNKSNNNPLGNMNAKKKNLIKDYNFDEQYRKCKLYQSFVDGSEHLSYDKRYGILLNMINISGGEKRFLDIINSPLNEVYSSYQNKDWSYICEYSRKQGYAPMSCNSFCSYCNDCNHGINIIYTTKNFKNQTSLLEQHPDNITVQLSEAELDLREKFYKAINSDLVCIHLIIAQAGMGKSELYINYLKNTSDKYLIAVPTITLKNDITRRLNDKGVNAMAYPSLDEYADKDLKDEINKMYSIGAHELANVKIRKEAMSNDNIQSYLENKKNIKEFDGHVVTTHKNLTLLPKEYLRKFRIIIDEDILTTLLEIKSVRKDNLEYLRLKLLKNKDKLDTSSYKNTRGRLDYLLDDVNEEQVVITAPLNVNIHPILPEIVNNPKQPIDSNIVDIFKASGVYLHKKQSQTDKNSRLIDTFSYIVKNELPAQKIIVLSATADPILYQLCFGNDAVKVYKCKEAIYKGRIHAISDQNFSRKFLNDNDIIIDELKILLKDYPVITFLSLKSKFENDIDIHFGKTEGINDYEGKDIAIVGTPFQTDVQCKLYAAALGHIASGSDADMRHQPIEFSCFKFHFMSYADEVLRRVQLWLIYTDLDQAIGRARLLRNDCTIYLFSSLPIKQSNPITYKEFCESKNFISNFQGRKKTNALSIGNND